MLNCTMPKDGKVVIVDNNYNEVLPLVRILNKDNIPVLYYSGDVAELPSNPLQGIRLIFLDLRFNPSTDAKSIVSNAYALLHRILGKNNGPYMLLVWTSTGTEYESALTEMLNGMDFKPERIQFISKSDYFEMSSNSIIEYLEGLEEGTYDRQTIEKIKSHVTGNFDEVNYIFRKDSLDKLSNTIEECLQEASLLSLFIEWENKTRETVPEIVNEIFALFPPKMEPKDKLNAMAEFLAEKSMGKSEYKAADDSKKIVALIDQMNELLEHFIDLKRKEYVDYTLPKAETLSVDFPIANFNAWKMIRENKRIDAPGKLYIDASKSFILDGLIRETDRSEEIIKEIRADDKIISVLLNISGECEISQQKYSVIRVVPGILFPVAKLEELIGNKKIKDYKKEKLAENYFAEFKEFTFRRETYVMFYNMAQVTYLDKSALGSLDAVMELARPYYLKVRNAIAMNFNKQGLDLF